MRDRIGETSINNEGFLMKVTEYKDARNIIIEFQDEYKAKVHATYTNFKKGSVANPYNKTSYNIGYIGQGKYTPKICKKIYDVWRKMLQRCYDPYFINKELTYKDVYVCDEWHCFQNFAKWWEENYYEILNEKMELDKDILIKNNKMYSPKTCLIVPQRLNKLFTKSDKMRGEYPIGVNKCVDKRNGYNYEYLRVRCQTLNGRKFLGNFPLNKPFQAFTCYKEFKERYVKQVADEYKDLIPKELYDALYKYEVEVND